MTIDGGLFQHTLDATDDMQDEIDLGKQWASGIIKIGNEGYISIDDYMDNNPIVPEGETYTTISTKESYVGCYANLDDDPEPEGVIYADLAKGVSGNYYGNVYSKEAETTGLKEYYVSGTSDGLFGNGKQVITVVPNTSGIKDRFYVMALIDYGTSYTWYDAAYDNENTTIVTADDFGSGRTNTITMIEKWDNIEFGAQDDHPSTKDIWGQIKTEVSAGWFVPSKGEWAAFCDELDYSKDSTAQNYFGNFGLKSWYWSSSQYGARNASRVVFSGTFGAYTLHITAPVRLSTTF